MALFRTWTMNLNKVVISTKMSQHNKLKSNAHLRKHFPKGKINFTQKFTVCLFTSLEEKPLTHQAQNVISVSFQNNHRF